MKDINESNGGGKPETTSIELKRNGLCGRVLPVTKNGTQYFVLDYRLNGERKRVWRSSVGEAREAFNTAADKIAGGESAALDLTNADAFMFARSTERLAGTGLAIDEACKIVADVLAVLGGRVTPIEAARAWVNSNKETTVKISIAAACDEMNTAAAADGKSKARQAQIAGVLRRLCQDFSGEVAGVTPDQISRYLSGLKLSERSKRNHRDVLGFFNRWLCLRKYLPKGADWFENVQNYSARKQGEITIYTPADLVKLLGSGNGMTAFIAIGAFAGLRHAEIARLDWSEIDLEDGFIEVLARKSKTGERRLVPISENLKAWLKPVAKKEGAVTPYLNTTKQLLKIAKTQGVAWQKNALRHSFISYRVAQSADVARVADEAGNSTTVIRQNYLRRVKPAQAAEWFNVLPN